MNTLTFLLAATDFSEDGRYAVQRAALVAAAQQARLDLLHVVNGPALGRLLLLVPTSVGARAKLVDDAQRALDELAADITRQTGVTTGTRIGVGVVLDEILAGCTQADLLALGARGTNPLRDLILGSTAERLLRKCDRPILVVKRPVQGDYRRVIVPVDFSPSSAAALRMALRIAPGAEIMALHAFEVPFEGKLWLADVSQREIDDYRARARQQAQERLGALVHGISGDDPYRIEQAVEHGEAAQTILAQEQALDADLIVMGKHGQSAVEDFFLGSVTRHVLADANCDVLVVQAAADAALPSAG